MTVGGLITATIGISIMVLFGAVLLIVAIIALQWFLRRR